MIHQKIGKIRIATGLESQRIQKIQETGELFFTINGGLYVGDDITYGGIRVSNRCYVISTTLTAVPSFAVTGDIIINKYTGYNYIVSLTGSTLYLNQIGSDFDPTSLSSLPAGVGSVSASSLNQSVIYPSGGLGLDALSGLYINYDTNTLTISGGKLTLVPQNTQQITYTYNTVNGGIYDGVNNKLAVDVDNTTLKIVNNQLSAIGNPSIYVVNSTIYKSFTASDFIANTYVNFDGSVSMSQINPNIGFRFYLQANSTNFSLVSTGFSFKTSDIGTVFRIVNYNNGLNVNGILALSGIKITSVQGSSAFGTVYGGMSSTDININGTGTSVGATIQYEPKIRDSQNIKWIKKNGIGDYTIFFENNFDEYNYGITFSTKGVLNGNLGRQSTAHISMTEPMSTNYVRIETGYQNQTTKYWAYNDCSIVNANFIQNKGY